MNGVSRPDAPDAIECAGVALPEGKAGVARPAVLFDLTDEATDGARAWTRESFSTNANTPQLGGQEKYCWLKSKRNRFSVKISSLFILLALLLLTQPQIHHSSLCQRILHPARSQQRFRPCPQ